MEDLKELIDHPACCWGYIDELRMALAAACKERDEARKELHETKSEVNSIRNELCCKCGNYREAHNGACDGCRWNGVSDGKENT